MKLSGLSEQFKSFTAELRTRQYYAGDVNRSSSLAGVLMDFIFLRALVFVAAFFIILYLSGQPTFSFVTSIALTLVFSMILHNRRKKYTKQNALRSAKTSQGSIWQIAC